MLAGGEVRFRGLAVDGDDVYWGESRPSEGGRVATMRWRHGTIEEVQPGFDARTLVHEYGGQSLAADAGRIVATAYDDQRIHRLDGDRPWPITPEPPSPRGWRHADTVFAGDRVITVREDHTVPSGRPDPTYFAGGAARARAFRDGIIARVSARRDRAIREVSERPGEPLI